jgi:adenylate kinase family enzyme
MKVLVFGNSGSGKSTYSRDLAATHHLPHLDLDSIVWEPGQIAVQRLPAAIAATLQAFLANNAAWVIEGCYGELVETVSPHCTRLVFLNPGMASCLANNLRRSWEPHKYTSLAAQNAMLEGLQVWVASYYTRSDSWSYQAHRRIFAAHTGAKAEYTSSSKLLAGLPSTQ